jgi:DNA-directed RNA polymerase subunit L
MSQSSLESKPVNIPKSSIILPNVKESIETKGVLTFTLENTNVSIANALRRTILSNIDVVVIDGTLEKNNVQIYKNTTKFNNEILKQRLGCIPIHIKNHDLINDLLIEINEVNDSDSMIYITTKDFKVKNISSDTYLDDEEIKKMFPPDKLTNGYILFTRLRPKISNNIPGQEIHIECKLSISNAEQNGMYNSVSTCAYANTPDRVEQNAQWEKTEKELEEKGHTAKDITDIRKNWYLLRGKRFYKKDSFDFKIETVGVYTNMELVHLASDNIIKRLGKLYDICQTEKLIIQKDTTTMSNSADITLENEDYTIGKIIEYILHKEYYLGSDRVLDYIGFIKKHPHDTDSIIRLSFHSAENSSNENIRSLVSYACQTGINIFTNLTEFF